MSELSQKVPRSQWLDIVRGVAIFGVVTVHTMGTSNGIVTSHFGHLNDSLTNISRYGRYGVELFFFLSGWLLVSIYGADSSTKLGKSYWIRRAARIYPLWILFLLADIFTSSFGRGLNWTTARRVSPGQSHILHSPTVIIILTLTFTLWISASLWNTVIPGGWSIQCEVAHYILFAVMRKYSLSTVIRVMTVTNYLSCCLYLISSQENPNLPPSLYVKVINAWIQLNIFATFSYFFLGIISFQIFSKQLPKVNSLIMHRAGISGRLIFFFVVSFVIVPLNFGSQVECLGTVIVLLLLSTGIHRIRLLSYIFEKLGKYSFFIYFLHFKILYFIADLFTRWKFSMNFYFAQMLAFIVVLLVTLLLSIMFAIPSFRFIEYPIINFTRKKTNKFA